MPNLGVLSKSEILRVSTSYLSLGGLLAIVLYVPTPNRLGPGANAAIGALLLGLFLWLLQSGNRWEQKEGPGGISAILAICLVSTVALLAVQAIFHLPMDAEYADMLPLIQKALDRLWQGESPYHVYQMPWPLPLTFLPGLWLSYLPPWLLGIDLRFLGLLATIGLAGKLAGMSARPGGNLPLFVLLILAASAKYSGFSRIGHLYLYWFVLLLFADAMAKGRRKGAFVWFAALLTMRQTALLLLPPVAYHFTFRKPGDGSQGNLLSAVKPLFLVVGLPLLLLMPFFVWAPNLFVQGTVGWYLELPQRVFEYDPPLVTGQLGFAGLFYDLEIPGLLSLLRIGAVLGVYILTRHRWKKAQGALGSGALALFVFALSSAPCWWYSLFSPLLLLLPNFLGQSEKRRWRGTIAGATAVCVALTWIIVTWPNVERLDFDSSTRPRLLEGFYPPEGKRRSFAWAEAPRARLSIPRLRRFEGNLRVVLQPAAGVAGAGVQIELNGELLATFNLKPGWRVYKTYLPPGSLLLGNNSLVFRGKAATGRGTPDPRPLVVAIDEVVLLPATRNTNP